MLFLTRMFGVTGSDAERDLASEKACIEEITERVLQMQAKAANEQRYRSVAVHMPRAHPHALNSKCSTSPLDGIPRSPRAWPKEFSPSPACIPRSSALEIQIRR